MDRAPALPAAAAEPAGGGGGAPRPPDRGARAAGQPLGAARPQRAARAAPRAAQLHRYTRDRLNPHSIHHRTRRFSSVPSVIVLPDTLILKITKD